MSTYTIISKHGKFIHEKTIEANDMGDALDEFEHQLGTQTIVDILEDGESRMAFNVKPKLKKVLK